MPKMRKKAQQIMTMLLMGLRLESRVCTTSLRPGALKWYKLTAYEESIFIEN